VNNLRVELFHHCREASDIPEDLFSELGISNVTHSVQIEPRDHEWDGVIGYSTPIILDFLHVHYEIDRNSIAAMKKEKYGFEIDLRSNNVANKLESEDGDKIWIPPESHEQLQDLGLILIGGRSQFCNSIRQSLRQIGIPESKVIVSSW
jgi:hypothetical protein